MLKGKVSDGVFIDHCVDLSHNSNVYFDKGAGIFRLWDEKTYKDFLDRKRLCTPQELIQGAPGKELNRLLQRADTLQILRGYRENPFLSGEVAETEQQLLDYDPIAWKNKPLNAVILENFKSCREERQADRREEEAENYQLLQVA